MKELNEEIKDAAGEISNMISGQARQRLEELGISLQAANERYRQGKMNDGFEDRSFGEEEAVQQIQQCLKLLTQESKF
jgi:hypothetical protein